MFKFTILLFLFILLFFLSTDTFAKTNQFLTKQELEQFGIKNYEDINPNLLTYPLKRTYENFIFLFKFNQKSKQLYSFKLFEKRFREYIYIINSDKKGFLTDASVRYNSMAGAVKPFFLINDKTQKAKIINYKNLLEKLRDRYRANSAEWTIIQQSIEVTKSLI